MLEASNVQQWWFLGNSKFEGCLRACSFLGWLANKIYIYRQKVLELEIIRFLRSHVMVWKLVCEANFETQGFNVRYRVN